MLIDERSDSDLVVVETEAGLLEVSGGRMVW